MNRIRTRAAAAVLLAIAMGCQSVDGPPERVPDIRGTITAEEADGRIRVEENPNDQSGSNKAVVRITDRTTLLRRNGSVEPATVEELRTGRIVSIWFDGPVLESYPVQAGAQVIVIEE